MRLKFLKQARNSLDPTPTPVPQPSCSTGNTDCEPPTSTQATVASISTNFSDDLVPPMFYTLPALDDSTLKIPAETGDFLDPDAESPSATFIKRFKDILASDQPMLYVNIFNKIPAPRPQAAPRNTSFMQRLYERNRRRAVWIIMGDSKGHCEIDPGSLAEHFFPDCNFIPDDELFASLNKAGSHVDCSSISPEEVWAKLSKSENTAPGPDRITFQHWKRVDPDAKALVCIFNLCLKFLKIPDS